MADAQGLRLCTYNCRSMKNSLHDIRELCRLHDLVLLQEHWLLPFELNLLNRVCDDFMATGVSAVNITDDVLKGRPYGGTAILYRKAFSSSVCVVDCAESRMCAIKLATSEGLTLLVNVYMPTDVSDTDSCEEYVDICSKIATMFVDSDAVRVIVAGDFNCRPGTRFHKIYTEFLVEHELVCVDSCRLQNAVTFISDDGLRTSWIDHIVCSQSLLPVTVSYGMICSDHRPLSAVLGCSLTSILDTIQPGCNGVTDKYYPCWDRVCNEDISRYQCRLDELLSAVNIPADLLSCNGECSDLCEHRSLVDMYYDKIISCIVSATENVIPHRKICGNEHNVTGWADYVEEKHDIARQAFLQWCHDGKPRLGPGYLHMYRSRAAFKQALRFCKRNKERLQADALALSYNNVDAKKFWKGVTTAANRKATANVNKISGAVGEQNICNMWCNHFRQLYNSVHTDSDKCAFYDTAANIDKQSPVRVTVADVRDAIAALKNTKAPGPNGVHTEAFKYAGFRLWTHLSLFYTFCLCHSYVPDNFMSINIVPLVKNKCGDLTDVNNYRAIALCNIDTKVLEKIVLAEVTTYHACDDHQFGFKKNHSTTLCTAAVKQTIDYYARRGSHVFVCFIDYSKAFDKVNYWKIFGQLLDDSVNSYIVLLLAYWYSHQQASVIWMNTRSSAFTVGNGTKQGGILSPYLFSRYIRLLLYKISVSKIGCHIGGMAANVFAYADDVVLLAPSWHGMQDLIAILTGCCKCLDLECNVRKTKCMVVNPISVDKTVRRTFPCFSINGQMIEFVTEFKYLGHILSAKMQDDCDITREIRNMYARTNMLVQRFRKCSLKVKLAIFKAYFMCFYGISLWWSFNVSTMLKFKYCYNKCVKKFFGYKKYDSATAVFMELKLPTANTVLHNHRSLFKACWKNHSNSIVSLIRDVYRPTPLS